MTELGSFLGDPLADPLVRRAALEVALIGIAGGTLGCWIIHFRLAYAAESMAHAMLPGLVLAALAGLPLALGGALGLLVGSLAIALVSRTPGVDRDAAVAIAVTALFGLGGLLALSPDVPQNLGRVLFGDVLSTGAADLWLAAGLVAVTLVALVILHPRLLAIGFDGAQAGGIGLRPAVVEGALMVLLAAAVLVAVQGLGNLLAVASLVGPPAAASLVAKRMAPMMLLAVGVAVVSGIAGLYASYHLELAAGASIAGATVLACGAVLAPAGLDGLGRRQRAAPTMERG
jgi:ABC-type Mn2+/Zn2+ transport system permease subunit